MAQAKEQALAWRPSPPAYPPRDQQHSSQPPRSQQERQAADAAVHVAVARPGPKAVPTPAAMPAGPAPAPAAGGAAAAAAAQQARYTSGKRPPPPPIGDAKRMKLMGVGQEEEEAGLQYRCAAGGGSLGLQKPA